MFVITILSGLLSNEVYWVLPKYLLHYRLYLLTSNSVYPSISRLHLRISDKFIVFHMSYRIYSSKYIYLDELGNGPSYCLPTHSTISWVHFKCRWDFVVVFTFYHFRTLRRLSFTLHLLAPPFFSVQNYGGSKGLRYLFSLLMVIVFIPVSYFSAKPSITLTSVTSRFQPCSPCDWRLVSRELRKTSQ